MNRANADIPQFGDAKQHYDALLRMAERYGVFADRPAALASVSSDVFPMTATESFDATADAVDSAPLYLFSAKSESRAFNVGDAVKLPTIPTGGATLVDSKSAVYLRLDDHITEGVARQIVKRGLTPMTTCRFLCGSTAVDEKHGLCDGLLDASVVIGRTSSGQLQFSVVRIAQVTAVKDLDLLLVFYSHMTRTGEMLTNYARWSYDGKRMHGFRPNGQEMFKFFCTEAREQIHVALAELDFIDQPCHYVVEQRPDNVKPERIKRAKAARFDDRERWILLDPEEVKVHFAAAATKAAGGTHASPVPHLRRAHNRVLRDARYTYMRGTTIHVRPVWVGDREWSYQGARYKVISRPGASATQA